MKQFFLIVLFISAAFTFAQISYQGPAVGNVASGVVVNTNNFPEAPINIDPQIIRDRSTESPYNEPFISNFTEPVTPSIYVEDPLISGVKSNQIGANTLLLKKFPGIPQTNSIPPDPTIAVGPNHVVACVNSRFSIWDKNGNLLKSIDADQWCTPVLANPGAFDPQIIYDHFEGRWFMLWDNVNNTAQTAFFLIFVSDDNDPLGVWYGYKLDARTNGNTVTATWGDYPQVGFDDKAIYINARQFYFTGGKLYDKIRILIKSELYAANGGPLTWKDLWGITIPGTSTMADVVHPSIQYGISNEHYFIWAARSGGNFYGFYVLSNVLTNPTLTGRQIPTQFYGQTPNANQLGGGSLLIETNGSHVKTAPVFRNGFLHFTHSIRNTNFPSYASVRYVKLNVATNTITEIYELGADRYWYFYPTVAVDPEGNVAITCSRSGLDEYIGSFYITRKANDPPGLSEARLISPGLGNYVKDFGSGRNRWGDYLGIYSDPADEYNFWLFPEHAAATNTWGTTVAQIRVRPFFGVYAFTDSTDINFGNVEVGFSSDTVSLVISNYGDTPLIINNIPDSVNNFRRVSNHSFPLTLNSFDSLRVRFIFRARSAGLFNVTYPVVSNSPNFTGFTFRARGFVINPAQQGVLYSISGTNNNGNLSSINVNTGVGSNIGVSNFTDIIDLAIHPTTNVIYGLRSSTTRTELLRINSANGDAYFLRTLPVTDLFSIEFDRNGVLYGTRRTVGDIYRFDLQTGDSIFVSRMPTGFVTIAFDPLNNEAYGSVRNVLGSVRDRIIKINLQTGDTIHVGRTGFGVNTVGITFNSAGVLYGIKGLSTQVSDLFTINKTTGEGTLIGPIGLEGLQGIAFSRILTGVENNEGSVPSQYILFQNYPNPFNPSTRIDFSVPVQSDVKLQIFNVIGELVYEFERKDLSAGTHSVLWNGLNFKGNFAGSGIYFYKLVAIGVDNSQFQQVRKMSLIK
jgi:hypothetical protein